MSAIVLVETVREPIRVTLAPRSFVFFRLPVDVEKQFAVAVVTPNARPLDVVVRVLVERSPLAAFPAPTRVNHSPSLNWCGNGFTLFTVTPSVLC